MDSSGFEIKNFRPISFMLGPCVLESSELAFEVAERISLLKEINGALFIFKGSFLKDNRTSFSAYRGPGLEKGLEILQEVKQRFSLPIMTDVHDLGQIGRAAEVVDIIQIPAFLSRQTSLIEAAAATGRHIMIKKGQFMSPGEARYAVKKARNVMTEDKVFICERGTQFGYEDVIFDVRSIQRLKENCCTVIFDASHTAQSGRATSGQSLGDSRFTPVLARSAVAAGIAGIYIETHPKPTEALCDKSTQFPLDQLAELVTDLANLDRFVKASMLRMGEFGR